MRFQRLCVFCGSSMGVRPEYRAAAEALGEVLVAREHALLDQEASGLGGAIVVPTQAAVLGMGVDALVIAFVVVVIGGLGSLKGALVGALVVAFVRTAGIQFFPELELAVLYLIAAGVLLVRPTGLFGTA